VDADFGFASYHSKSEVRGNVIRCTLEFEVKQLSVPVSKAEELKKSTGLSQPTSATPRF
jgi:hypothetical protein